MKLSELITLLENCIPPSLQESYDNTGLQVGDPEMELSSALLSLDATEQVLDEVISSGANLLITHHPLIYKEIMPKMTRATSKFALTVAVHHSISLRFPMTRRHI